jgi:hypothetical protein
MAATLPRLVASGGYDLSCRKKGPPRWEAEWTLSLKEPDYRIEDYLGRIGTGVAGTVTVQSVALPEASVHCTVTK